MYCTLQSIQTIPDDCRVHRSPCVFVSSYRNIASCPMLGPVGLVVIDPASTRCDKSVLDEACLRIYGIYVLLNSPLTRWIDFSYNEKIVIYSTPRLMAFLIRIQCDPYKIDNPRIYSFFTLSPFPSNTEIILFWHFSSVCHSSVILSHVYLEKKKDFMVVAFNVYNSNLVPFYCYIEKIVTAAVWLHGFCN